METDEYVDGFVISVPKDQIDAYEKVASKAASIWIEHGAIEYRECVGDDLEVEDQVPFPEMAGTRANETVIFTYIVYPSREVRDAANQKIMNDPRVVEMCEETKGIFDFKRMAYGGFKTLVYNK